MTPSRRLTLHSSHSGAGSFGKHLDVRVFLEDGIRQVTNHTEVFFELPNGFTAHNDLVATALMAMFEGQFTSVHFNFPVSQHCADVLTSYYHLDEITPVDAHLEPRRPGKYLGVAFSGGLDSVAVLTMLHNLAVLDIRVITAEFEGFHREAVAYADYARDVSCNTNFRRHLGDAFRFDAVVPILFADYADLYGFCGGHTLGNMPLMWSNPLSDEPLEFLRSDPLPQAAGLIEAHIVRCLLEYALLQVLVRTAPERVELGLHGTGRSGERKHTAKALALRHAFRQAGRRIPPFLEHITWPTQRAYRRIEDSIHLRSIWIRRFASQAAATRLAPRVAAVNWEPIDSLSLDLFARYNSILAEYIPAAFRAELLAGFRACGVEPYSRRDHEELEVLRQFILAVNEPHNLRF